MQFVTEITREQFVTYSKNADKNNYLQTIEMADLKMKRGYDIYFVGLKNETDDIIYVTLLTRIKIKIGYVFNVAGFEVEPIVEHFNFFMSKLKQFVKQNQGTYLVIDPNSAHKVVDNEGNKISEDKNGIDRLFLEENFTWKKPTTGFNENGNPFWIYIKDIKGMNEKSLEDSYHKSAKYYLKKNKQFGIEIRSISYEELNIFKEITEATSERRHFQDKSLSYYQEMYKIYGDNAKFLIAELNVKKYIESLFKQQKQLENQIEKINEYLSINTDIQKMSHKKKENQKRELTSQVETYNKRIKEADDMQKNAKNDRLVLACALFITCPQETIYLFSGTVEAYKNLYAPFLIQDHMLKYSVANQVPKYNFYGIEGVFDGTDGILKFKEAFNGVAVELMGEFTYISSPLKYKVYFFLKKLLAR